MLEQPMDVAEHSKKLTRADVDRILSEDNGASALIVMMRHNKVDADIGIYAIVRHQNTSASVAKRVLVAFIEAILPS